MFEKVDLYINKMPFSDSYKSLDTPLKQAMVFAAEELLKDHYKESLLTDRLIALQTLFVIEGEDEEYSKMKRHGVTSFATKGVSASFEGDNISPDVKAILGEGKSSKKAFVGRLI
ncbi:hypothetical protein [Metabacillus litoralis]|uniref:hypothetical protein n=1 Tax=Metabacillus litoralis TaxID=152268 RepID=UPI00203C0872|nr:hypothetical protein [Metabacillus litoralis]MCM3651327.1 hypothetical protein [Metabacillus litoralis]